MKKFAKLAAVAAIASSAFAAQADVLIDSFSTDQGIYSVSTAGASLNGVVTTAGDDIIGGSREIWVYKTAPLAGPGASNPVSVQVADGALSFNSGSNATGFATVLWDGNVAAGNQFSLGLDLSGETSFKLALFQSDAGFPFTLTAYTSATQWTSLTFAAFEVSTPTDFNISLAAFLLGDVGPQDPTLNQGLIARQSGVDGNVDFSSVGALQASINYNGPANVDLTILNASTVPEPGSLALLGLGLLGMGALRRRKSV